jgi:hypothetical protein
VIGLSGARQCAYLLLGYFLINEGKRNHDSQSQDAGAQPARALRVRCCCCLFRLGGPQLHNPRTGGRLKFDNHRYARGKRCRKRIGVKGAGLTTSCEEATYGGTAIGVAAAEVTVRPTYFKCKTGGINSPVDVNGCTFVLKAATTASTNTAGGAINVAGATIECPNLNEIIITASGCEIGIGTTHANEPTKVLNHNLDGVTYTNIGAGATREITVTVEIDNITYTSKGELCAFGGLKETGTNAFLTTKVKVKALKHTNGTPCPNGFDDFTACEGAQTAAVHDDV